MKVVVLAIVLSLLGNPAFAQEQTSTAENPLAQLKDEVERVLEEGRLPFTEEQESSIILMMEDRRKASEDLFGELLDFRAGPTQGQEADRLRSAIEWMRNEFLVRLTDYLTPEQLTAWSRYREITNPAASSAGGQRGGQRGQNQTQFVRINNNAFTAEDAGYRFGRGGQQGGGGGQGGGGTEVIQRGGVGAFHGNAQLLFQDEKLNAGRRFASNKPPYQQRRFNFDVGGPLIPGKLTTNFAVGQSNTENVGTIRATLPDSIFALGITSPTTNRSYNSRNTLQLSDAHSLTLNFGYQTNKNENQNVGGFTLPERASTNTSRNWNFEVRQFSSLSSRSIFETRFNVSENRNETIPQSEAVKINVLDAFNGGGAQNRAENTNRPYTFSTLYTQLGEKLTLKTGLEGIYRKDRSVSENNFFGTFTFPNLEDYVAGKPSQFRVNRGTPLTETTQTEVAFFVQNDVKLTPSFTLMYGARYEFQTNISDHNNIDPRLGFAYAIGRATVIRAGTGIFHQRIPLDTIENQRRFDGTRQYEIIVDNPSYPDPFQAGTVTQVFPSVRVTDPDITTPYNFVSMLSYERTFFSNLFISVAYDYNREVHRLRNRNLNAPMDITSSVPKSCSVDQSAETCVRPYAGRGNIINLESTGSENANAFRVTFRQRFSIFNVSANYSTQFNWSDTFNNFNQNNQGGGGGNQGGNFGLPDGLPSDSYHLRADWSRAAFPLHTLNTSLNAQLPLGIFLTNTMSTNSGRAYTITTGRDDNQDTTINDRPLGVKRNSEPGPKIINFNFNISKAFFFSDTGPQNGGTRTNINLFANMTNAFNRPNYGQPSGVMTSRNFGKSTNAGEPREIEVGLRFQF